MWKIMSKSRGHHSSVLVIILFLAIVPIKGPQLCAFCPQFEFKLCYLKNLKLFSIRVKELFEPIVLLKIGNGFCSFEKQFLEKPIFE